MAVPVDRTIRKILRLTGWSRKRLADEFLKCPRTIDYWMAGAKMPPARVRERLESLLEEIELRSV